MAESVYEIVGLAVLGAAILVAFAALWGASWTAALAVVAQGAMEDAAWVLPTLIGVIVSFYVVLIGQQITRTAEDIRRRTRNRVGGGAQLVAAIAVVYMALSVGAAIAEPSATPKLFSVIVVGSTIVILGVSAGRFTFGTRQEQLALARSNERFSRRALAKLAVREPWTVIAAWCLIIGNVLLPDIVLLSASAMLQSIGWMNGEYDLVVATAVGVTSFGAILMLASAYVILVDRDFVGKILSVTTMLIPLVLVLIIVFTLPEPSVYEAAWSGSASVVGLLLWGCLVYLPILPRFRPSRNVFAGSAILSLSVRRLALDEQKARARMEALEASSAPD